MTLRGQALDMRSNSMRENRETQRYGRAGNQRAAGRMR